MTRTSVAIRTSSLSWGAILCGWVFAYAFAMLLYNLGAALGITTLAAMNEFRAGVAFGTAAWFIFSWIIATFAGAWVAGRLAGPLSDPVGGLHGMIVWALSAIMTMLVATLSASALVTAGAKAGEGLIRAGETVGATVDAPNSVQQGLRTALSEQAAGVMAQNAGGTVSQDQVRQSIQQLDQPTINELAVTLARGDTQQAEQVLAQHTDLNQDQVRQVIAGTADTMRTQLQAFAQEAGEAVEQAGDYTSGALWTMFLASLLGLIAGATGGRLGTRKAAEYFAAHEAAVSPEDFPAYADHS